MKVLFLGTVLPGRMMGGSELWSQTIINGLRRNGASVTVLGYQRLAGEVGPGEVPVSRRTVETSRAPLSALRWGAEAFVARRPYTVQKWIGREYREHLQHALASERWDFVVLDHASCAWTLDAVRGMPIIHLSHQAEAQLYRAHSTAARGPARVIYAREGRLLAEVEARLARRASAIWCVSMNDETYFRALGANEVLTLPPLPRPGWAQAAWPALGSGPDVALLGSWTWKPNRNSLRWFLREVWPRLPNDWSISIGGKYNRKEFAEFPASLFSGLVEDPFTFLRRAARVAVPSDPEHGVAMKLLDAIAAMRPLVARKRAIRTIGLGPSHLVGADSPQDFADALCRAPPVDQNETRAWLSARQTRFDDQLARSVLRILSGKR